MQTKDTKANEKCLLCSLIKLSLLGAVSGFILSVIKSVLTGQASWSGLLKSFLAIGLFLLLVCLFWLIIFWIKNWVDALLREENARSKSQPKPTTEKYPAHNQPTIPNCTDCGKAMNPGFNKGEYYWRCPDLPFCNRSQIQPYKPIYTGNFIKEVITTESDKARYDQFDVLPSFSPLRHSCVAKIGQTTWIVNLERNVYLIPTGGGAHEHPDCCFEMIFPDGRVDIAVYSCGMQVPCEELDAASQNTTEYIRIYDICWFGISKDIKAIRQEIIDLFYEAAQAYERSKVVVNHGAYINFTEVKRLKSHGIIEQ